MNVVLCRRLRAQKPEDIYAAFYICRNIKIRLRNL